MTAAHHQSGTDRLAEVAGTMLDCDMVVNVQGDEPLLEPRDDRRSGRAVRQRSVADDEHAAAPDRRSRRPQNPNVTKVVVDQDRLRAVFLARADSASPGRVSRRPPPWRAHRALRLPSRSACSRLAALPPTALERAEALEQLRALEHGIRIKAIETSHEAIGVDTPEDLARVRACLLRPSESTPCIMETPADAA